MQRTLSANVRSWPQGIVGSWNSVAAAAAVRRKSGEVTTALLLGERSCTDKARGTNGVLLLRLLFTLGANASPVPVPVPDGPATSRKRAASPIEEDDDDKCERGGEGEETPVASDVPAEGDGNDGTERTLDAAGGGGDKRRVEEPGEYVGAGATCG